MATTVLHRNKRGKIAELTIDALLREVHRTTSDVTQHPVEKGANIADHIRRRPDELSLEGVVSNTPIEKTDREAAGAAQRAETAYLRLLELQNAGQLVTVVTHLRTYENMAISSLDAPRDSSTGDVLQFVVSFTQVRTVSSRTVAIVAAKTGRAQPKGKNGKQATKNAGDQQVKKSTLKRAADTGVGDAFLRALGAR